MAPSRTLVLVASLSVALLLAAIGWRLADLSFSNPTTINTPPVVRAPSPFIAEKDTDQDGIPDWQETLIGTDPDNADSDGDGVIDALPEGLVFETATTASGAITERLVDQYLYLKESGAYTPERGDQLAQSLYENLYVETTFTPFTLADISTQTNISREAYRRAMQEATAPFLDLQGAEFELYAQFIETEDRAFLDALTERAAVYELVAKNMLNVPVPQDAAHTHLAAVNATAYFGALLRDLVSYADDPFASFALLRSYNDAEQYVHATFSALATYYNRSIE